MLRIAVLFLFALPLLAAAGGRHPDVTGKYESNWDAVTLTQDGDRVRGTYVCCGGGTIEGKIYEGRILRYRWKQPGGWGMGVWKIEGTRLLGTWGWNNDDDDGGRWDLEREGVQLAAP